MPRLLTCLAELCHDEQGQDLIEYSLLATFVSLVAIGGASFLGTALGNWYSTTSGTVDNATALVGS
jgi:Flp pilus assembly pilin Flp